MTQFIFGNSCFLCWSQLHPYIINVSNVSNVRVVSMESAYTMLSYTWLNVQKKTRTEQWEEGLVSLKSYMKSLLMKTIASEALKAECFQRSKEA